MEEVVTIDDPFISAKVMKTSVHLPIPMLTNAGLILFRYDGCGWMKSRDGCVRIGEGQTETCGNV